MVTGSQSDLTKGIYICTNKDNNFTCRSQLLWLSLSRRGKRLSPFLDLMNCFHFHTYFSSKYCFRNSAFPWGFDMASWPVVIKISSNVTTSHQVSLFHCKIYKKQWCTVYYISEDVLTSCWETFFPGFIRCFGVLLEPQLGLGMDFITIRPHCGQRLNSSILKNK